MKKIFSAIVLLFAGLAVFASDLPARPEPPTLVTDMANVFTQSERSQLESKLVNFFANTSTQIAVVTVNDLQGYDKADFAFRLGEAWGIGDSRFNNGILILLKPKTANSNGEVFIAVGYGLEGVVPDITAKQIVEHEMIPLFKENNMYGGIEKATSVLIDLTKGEYNYKQYAKKTEKGGFNPFIIFILLFVVFPILFGRRRRGFYSTGNRSSLPFWLALGMMSGAGRKHSGFFNDFSSGSGSFGGGGSSFGSFGGFGGGGFGGGGAGGSW
ncbi:MAG: TPM domain-containing protein [Prolixibacteraceae bacterium]|nr:TPM domain-containing protein [Prolixibacteraceae bacterium]